MTEETLRFEGDELYHYYPLSQYGEGIYKKDLVMTKEVFIECYKRWIRSDKEMNQKQSDMFLTSVINTFKEYQKDWLTSHNDIELEKELEDLMIRFLEDTAELFIREYTE